jgi:hypothetical protein
MLAFSHPHPLRESPANCVEWLPDQSRSFSYPLKMRGRPVSSQNKLIEPSRT